MAKKHFRFKSFLFTAALIFYVFLISSTVMCTSEENSLEIKHKKMIEGDLKARGINSPAVISAMEKVKRHLFVDKNQQKHAYSDHPLPIGEGQTISQPYIVGLMTQSLELNKSNRVLEIGTGSGYQAAVLSEIVKHVYSIEINGILAQKSAQLLKSLGYKNVSVKEGDGYYGWEEHSPFDAIIITCSAEKIPPPLIKQLKNGGKIILPMGNEFQIQNLVLGIKKENIIITDRIIPVRFVPMTGKAKKSQAF